MTTRASDDGAVTIIVTLVLLVIFGMTALVIDVGGLLTTKRTMVSAADSAALAAAQSCATGKGFEATAQALALAQENVPSATALALPTYTGCTTGSTGGSVNVSYVTMKSLAFAPALGLPQQSAVRAGANAIWGAPSTMEVIPATMFGDGAGGFPCAQEAGKQCGFFYNNADGIFSGTGSNWGFISASTANGGWPASAGAPNSISRTCKADGNDLIDAINTARELSLVADPNVEPTNVCADDGTPPTWNNPLGQAIKDQEGKIRAFPVATGVVGPKGHEKYQVIGFALLMIKKVIWGEEAYGTEDKEGFCSEQVRFAKPNPQTFDASALYAGCLTQFQIVDPTPTVILPDGRIAEEGPSADYQWNASKKEIRWKFREDTGETSNPSINVEVRFTGYTPGKVGLCAKFNNVKDPNAICIITEGTGAALGGTNPLPGAPNFGVNAIRLSS